MAIDIYEIWDKYEKSKVYQDRKGLLRRTDKNWLMYQGKQWEACEDSSGLENLPVFNFIKPVVKYKVSTIAQHSVTAQFSDLNDENNEVVSKLNDLFSISWEKGKMNRKAWEALKHAAIQGDSYCYWGEGGDTRVPPQIIHNTEVFLGDENITDIQEQPYIIIRERPTVAVVRERARLQGIDKSEIDLIVADSENEENLGNIDEVGNKITTLLYMEKDKDGYITIARCTKNVMYEKPKKLQQTKGGEYFGYGLKVYPIVPMIWEEVPNDARGTSEVEQMIPNQLELNKTAARRAISVKMTAYPRIAYDEASLSNPEDLDKVGAYLKLNGGNAQAISSMISYLAPQAMSGDAKQLFDELLEQTRSLAGASDAQLGNIDLSRVSGTAAQTIRDQQQVPLNEQVSMYQDFVENVALTWFELWKTYYPNGINMDGIEVSPDEIANVTPNVRVDIAEDTTLSRMAAQQELTNLFNSGKISFEEFANTYPEHSSLPKDLLLGIVAARKEMMAQGQMPTDEMGNPLDPMAMQEGVNPGGASSGSYQSIQSQMSAPLVQ